MGQKNTYVLGLGDYCECIVNSDLKRWDPQIIDKKFLNRQHDIAQAQFEGMEELLKPLAKQGKILGLLYGNHEHEILKRHHTDLVRNLCRSLQVENLGWEAMIRLQFSRTENGSTFSYTIHAEHGSGSGKTFNKLEKRGAYYEADIYCQGHNHARAVETSTAMSLPRVVKFDAVDGIARPSIQTKKVTRIFTGSFLKKHIFSEKSNGYDRSPISYAERGGYNPASMGAIRIDFIPNEGDHHVRI